MKTKTAVVKYEQPQLAELKEWATLAQHSGIVPSETTQSQAMAIVQIGREIGLSPFKSLRSIFFIKGRVSMLVQLQLALAKQHGVTVKKMEVEDDHTTITLKRGEEEITTVYTQQDADTAGLTKVLPCSGIRTYKGESYECKCKKDPDYHKGAWQKTPKEMRTWRAIGNNLKIIAPDLVMGIYAPDEVESIDEQVITVIEPPTSTENEPEQPKEAKTPPNPILSTKSPAVASGQANKTPTKTGKLISPQQIEAVRKCLKDKKLNEDELCIFFEIENIKELQASEVSEAVRWVTNYKI